MYFPQWNYSFIYSSYTHLLHGKECFPGWRKTGDKTTRVILGNSEEFGVSGVQKGVAVKGDRSKGKYRWKVL
jgi:hypothetical protein